MTLVLAGSYREYKEWLRRSDDKSAKYLTEPALLGFQDFTLVRFGTWFLRRDLRAVEEILKTRRYDEPRIRTKSE